MHAENLRRLPPGAYGDVGDGCGETIQCGACNSVNLNQVCVDNQCVCQNGNVPCRGLCYCVDPTDSQTDICASVVETLVPYPCGSNGDCPTGYFCGTTQENPIPHCMTAVACPS